MGVRRLAVALLLCLPALVSCGDDDPGAEPSDPTSSAMVEPTSTDATTSSAATGLPVLPDDATQSSIAGAKAFVQHYLATVSFAMRTGHSEAARGLSLDSCLTCDSVLRRVDKIYAQGGSVRTHGWVADAMFEDPSKSDSAPIIATRVRQGAQVLVGADGNVIDRDPAKVIPMDIALQFTEQGWRIREIAVLG